MPDPRSTLTPGQLAYEKRRAAKAGVSLEKWLASKAREAAQESRQEAKIARAAKPAKPPGLLSRLIDRAHKPL